MSELWTPPQGEERVAWQWRFQASLGLVGVPTRDGRVLLPQRVKDYTEDGAPLLVAAYPVVSRPGDGQGGPDEFDLAPVAVIERVEVHAAELVAFGTFGSDSRSGHYRGALAIGAVWLGMDVRTPLEPEPLYRAVGFRDWRVRGAVMVAEPAWEPGLLGRPRVWRAPAGAAW